MCDGLAAVQFMALDGVHVVGTCSSAEKVQLLQSLSEKTHETHDALSLMRHALISSIVAFNYREEPAADALKRLCPDGVDFFFDNVGGSMRVAVLEAMNPKGQILTSGRIAQYDGAGKAQASTEADNPAHAAGSIGSDSHLEQREKQVKEEKGLVDHGQFYVGNWESEFVECTEHVVEMYKAGELVSKDTVVEGFRNLPEAFVGIFRGSNVGRMVVKVE